MAKAPTPIIPPNSLDEIISQVAELPGNAYKFLKAEIQSSQAFDNDKDRCEKLAEHLNLNAESVALMLSALAFLYRRINAETPGKHDSASVISTLLNGFSEIDLNEESKKILVSRLTELTEQSDNIELARKIRRLKYGFIKNGTNFASFIDLRPNFSGEFSSIRNFVPMIQFRILTDSDDPSQTEFIFQVDEKQLVALKQAVSDAEKKLAALTNSDAVTRPIQLMSSDSSE